MDPLGRYKFEEAFNLVRLAEELECLTMPPIEVKNLAHALRCIAAELHPDCTVEDHDLIEGNNGGGQDEEKMNDIMDEISSEVKNELN